MIYIYIYTHTQGRGYKIPGVFGPKKTHARNLYR